MGGNSAELTERNPVRCGVTHPGAFNRPFVTNRSFSFNEAITIQLLSAQH